MSLEKYVPNQELLKNFVPANNTLVLESLNSLDQLILMVSSGQDIGKILVQTLNNDFCTKEIFSVNDVSEEHQEVIYRYAQGYFLHEIADGWLFTGITLAGRDGQLTENIPKAKNLKEACEKIYKNSLLEVKSINISEDILENIRYGIREEIMDTIYIQ